MIFFGYVVVYLISEWNIVFFLLFWIYKFVLYFIRILIILIFFVSVVIVKGICFIIIVFINWNFVVWVCNKVDIFLFLCFLYVFSIVLIVVLLYLVIVICRVVCLWNFNECFFVLSSKLGYMFDSFVISEILFWFLIVKWSKVLFFWLGFWYVFN